MADTIRYQIVDSQSTTDDLEPEDWSIEDGMLRMDKEDETLFIPFDRVFWIRRESED